MALDRERRSESGEVSDHPWSPHEEVVRACLQAVLEHNALGHSFDTRMGVTRQEAMAILATWPDVSSFDPNVVQHTVANAVNEVANALSFGTEEWSRRFPVPRQQMQRLLRGFRWY